MYIQLIIGGAQHQAKGQEKTLYSRAAPVTSLVNLNGHKWVHRPLKSSKMMIK